MNDVRISQNVWRRFAVVNLREVGFENLLDAFGSYRRCLPC